MNAYERLMLRPLRTQLFVHEGRIWRNSGLKSRGRFKPTAIMAGLPETYVEGFHDVEAVKRMEYRDFGKTGLKVSKLSYGVSAVGSVFRETNDEESMSVIEHAIRHGVNWIDAAPWYGFGKGERIFGQAVKAKKIPRQAFYVSTKVGRYLPEVEKMFDFSAERVIQSVDESLERLGLEYIDVIQVHDPEFAPSLDVILNETLPAMQKVKESGKAKFIGITGYPLKNFKTLLERSLVKIDTALTYCRYTLNDSSLEDYLPYFKSKGVGIFNGSPNGMGLLTNRGPAAWHPAQDDIKKVCAEAAKYCEENNVDISRLAIQFASNNIDVHTVLVSTASLKNIQSNIDSILTPLTDKEKRVLEEIRERYFKALNNKNWEGKEVAKYRSKLKAKMEATS